MRSLEVIATLAQNMPRGKQSSTTDVLVVVGALIVALVGLGLVIMFLRRRMLSPDSASWGQAGVMEELRRLRDSGELSPEEFEAVKGKIAGRVLGSARKKPPPGAAPKAIPPAGELRSEPGFDLTGRPLPKPNTPAEGGGNRSDFSPSNGGGSDGGGE